MPSAVLFFLAPTTAESSPAQDLVYKLSAGYDAVPLQPWTLSHRLFRETSSDKPTTQDKIKGQKYLQVLILSHHAPNAHVIISAAPSEGQSQAKELTSVGMGPQEAKPSEKQAHESHTEKTLGQANVISVSAGAPIEAFAQLLVAKFGPLWQQRQLLHVSNGIAMETGGFIVRVGEIKQSSRGVQLNRGTVCEVTLAEDDEIQTHAEQTNLIHAFWETLGMKSTREASEVLEVADDFASIRQWAEILRL